MSRIQQMLRKAEKKHKEAIKEHDKTYRNLLALMANNIIVGIVGWGIIMIEPGYFLTFPIRWIFAWVLWIVILAIMNLIPVFSAKKELRNWQLIESMKECE